MSCYFRSILIIAIILLVKNQNVADAQCTLAQRITQEGVVSISHTSTSSLLECREWILADQLIPRSILISLSSTILDCNSGSNIIVRDESRRELVNYCSSLRLGTAAYAHHYGRYLSIETNIRTRGASISSAASIFIFDLSAPSNSQPLNPNVAPATPPAPSVNVASCGRPSIQPSDTEMRIIGGTQAVPNSWPWQVLVSDSSGMCGGALLDNNWVITAAHCIQDSTASSIRVYFGMHDISSAALRNGYSIAQSRIIKHPEYNPRSLANDIALIRLATPVRFSERISPICLPSRNLATLGRVAMVTGWGRTSDFGRTSSLLRQVAIPINQNSACPFRLDAARQICAGSFTNTIRDSCNGDSGGPLVIRENGQFFLAGIVSFGGESCDGRGVYANVFAYLDWINRNRQ